MGHKVHPKSFRLGTTTTWPSRWFARDAAYRSLLKQDIEIRGFMKKELKDAQVSEVTVERSRGTLIITITTGKPGLIIGRSGVGIEDLKKKLLKTFFSGKKVQLQVNVVEAPKAALESVIVAQQVVQDLERRMPFRRVFRMAVERVKKAGALGVKIAVSGRLNGAEIARREWLGWGKIPLTNLRADIDFAQDTAHTMAGTIGVKVWIYRGDIFEQDRLAQYQPTTPSRARTGARDRRGPLSSGPNA
ncbi:30S ribosomal protein S3 [Patescibacteria group bacterium]|nr:30S ribosomal protein S3 [Patescibacteria group bacterium]MBU1448722.1 30S ribosomal protein S3 [Patescibacteria group bacterium]MBU2613112.1 30S ribosomal protein S3 [Patescibacteria group bacterium]